MLHKDGKKQKKNTSAAYKPEKVGQDEGSAASCWAPENSHAWTAQSWSFMQGRDNWIDLIFFFEDQKVQDAIKAPQRGKDILGRSVTSLYINWSEDEF